MAIIIQGHVWFEKYSKVIRKLFEGYSISYEQPSNNLRMTFERPSNNLRTIDGPEAYSAAKIPNEFKERNAWVFKRNVIAGGRLLIKSKLVS